MDNYLLFLKKIVHCVFCFFIIRNVFLIFSSKERKNCFWKLLSNRSYISTNGIHNLQWFLQLALLFSSLLVWFMLSTSMFMHWACKFLPRKVCFPLIFWLIPGIYYLPLIFMFILHLQMLQILIIQKLEVPFQLAIKMGKKYQHTRTPRRYFSPKSGLTRIISS